MTYCVTYGTLYASCNIGDWVGFFTAAMLSVAFGIVVGVALGASRFTQ